MLPILKSDDFLYFKKTTFPQIGINDLLLVKKERKIFTHRVIYKSIWPSVTKPYLITKGDNNLESDGKICPRQIIAKVTQVKRNGQVFNPESLYLLQSTLYFQEIVKIKKILEREKINFVFLKGLPLHLYYEKKHPQRVYADCDILIACDDVFKTKTILINFGFRMKDAPLSSRNTKLKKKDSEFSFYKKINNLLLVVFDIHVDAFFQISSIVASELLYSHKLIEGLSKKLLAEKQTAQIQNESFPVLLTSNLIIFLAIHFFKHNFRGEYRLAFLANVLNKNKKIDWRHIERSVKYYKLQNFVYPSFLLLNKYYAVNLPRWFISSIKPEADVLNYIRNHIMNINIFNTEVRINAGMTRFKNLFFLSPNPFLRRLMIIFNIQVIYSVFWVMIFFLRRSLNRSLRSV